MVPAARRPEVSALPNKIASSLSSARHIARRSLRPLFPRRRAGRVAMFRSLALDALLFAVAATHVALTPYAKVEESFNLQATHDVLVHGSELSAYDHHVFPGVVPRTFVGAIALAGATAPFRAALAAFGVSDDAYGTRVPTQMAARLALAALVVASLGRFRRALGSALGPPVGVAFALLTATQFHLLFYASRTLPNVFALVLTTLGAADWFEGRRHRRAVFLLVLAAIVFRCDAVLLLAPSASTCSSPAPSPSPKPSHGARDVSSPPSPSPSSSTPSCGARPTRPPDAAASWPSGRFWPGAAGVLWPEGAVLWFNVAENKSSAWGVSPWHWYLLTSALPRALLLAYPLAFLGATVEPRSRPLARAAATFVGLYSFLPHKELRFIFPAVPLMNACAACAVHFVVQGRWSKSSRSRWSKSSRSRAPLVSTLALCGAWFASVAAHAVFAAAARKLPRRRRLRASTRARRHAGGGTRGRRGGDDGRESVRTRPRGRVVVLEGRVDGRRRHRARGIRLGCFGETGPERVRGGGRRGGVRGDARGAVEGGAARNSRREGAGDVDTRAKARGVRGGWRRRGWVRRRGERKLIGRVDRAIARVFIGEHRSTEEFPFEYQTDKGETPCRECSIFGRVCPGIFPDGPRGPFATPTTACLRDGAALDRRATAKRRGTISPRAHDRGKVGSTRAR